jgi:hypothetical protein
MISKIQIYSVELPGMPATAINLRASRLAQKTQLGHWIYLATTPFDFISTFDPLKFEINMGDTSIFRN